MSEEDAKLQESLPEDDRRYGILRVHRTWNGRQNKFGPTKGGYWRTVPVSGELYWFLVDLKKRRGQKEFVFPQFADWKRGMQATILRNFCVSAKIKSIKFHALRATFATLLISKGVAPARVMKICGWKDLKTMQFYIRLAGIDEQGATEPLHLLCGVADQNRVREGNQSMDDDITAEDHEGDDLCSVDGDDDELTENLVQ